MFEPVGPEGSAPVGDVTSTSLAQHSEQYARNLSSLLSKRQRPSVEADGDGAGAGHPTQSISYSTLPAPAPAQDSEPPVDADARANAAMEVASPREVHLRSGAAVETPAGVEKPGAPAPVPAAAPPKAAPVEAQPAAAQESAKPQAAVPADLLQKLSGKLKDDPRDAVNHLNYQLLQFLLDEQVPDLNAIASLPAEDRELLTTLLDGLTNFRNTLRADANALQSRKVVPLLELAERLRNQAELSISAAALCVSVSRFGVYEPMDPPRFVAGKENRAILYCEVANFSSQLNDKKLWETKLKQEAVLYSETGLAVWQDKADTVVDESRNRLHDFFIADKVRLPANLPVGRYLMKMTVTDLHANRVAEATVPIQIVAQ